MKRFIITASLIIFVTASAFAQKPKCVQDVWMTLRNGQVLKAKGQVDQCYNSNPNSEDVLLIRGYVYLKRYYQELEKKTQESSYVIKDTNAVWIANESYVKALEINPKVEPMSGTIDATAGQIECAKIFADLGFNVFNTQKYTEAERYLKASIRGLKLKSNDGAIYLPYIYPCLAICALQRHDTIAYKDYLLEGVNIKSPRPDVYNSLYDYYKSKNEAAEALKIIKTGMKNVPSDSLRDQKSFYQSLFDYYIWQGDTAKIEEMANSFLTQFGETPANYALIGDYLNNAYLLTQAEIYLQKGLAMNPTATDLFSLYKQMTYRYYYGIEKVQKKIDAWIALPSGERKYNDYTAYKTEESKLREMAHDWAEKAYQLNPHDKYIKMMLKQLKMQLQKELPDDLK
jgi:hypothetical protein